MVEDQGESEQPEAQIVPAVPPVVERTEFEELEYRAGGTSVSAVSHGNECGGHQADESDGKSNPSCDLPYVSIKRLEDGRSVSGTGKGQKYDEEQESEGDRFQQLP